MVAERDWLDLPDDPPGIGHNSQAPGVDGVSVEAFGLPSLQELFAVLGVLSRFYISKGEPIAHDMRFAALQSLALIIKFGIAHGADGEQIAVLQKLMADIQEVSVGRRIRWMQPDRRRGRPAGVREDVAVLRAGYAAGMEMAIRAGRNVREAGREILRSIPKGSIALTGIGTGAGNVETHWTAVKRWRDDCIEKAPPSAMKTLYHQLLAREETHPGTIAAFLANPHVTFLRDPTEEPEE